jgi:hypothetical protein
MSQPAHVRDDIHPEGSDGDLYERYTNTQFVVNNRSLPAPLPCGEAAIDLHMFDTAEKFWSNAGRGEAPVASISGLARIRDRQRSATWFAGTGDGPDVTTGLADS